MSKSGRRKDQQVLCGCRQHQSVSACLELQHDHDWAVKGIREHPVPPGALYGRPDHIRHLVVPIDGLYADFPQRLT
eukprot:55921-Eustigmatos_ZCMA.PRE.1